MKIVDLKFNLQVERVSGSTLAHIIGQKGLVTEWKNDNRVRVRWIYDNKGNPMKNRHTWVNVVMIQPATE